MCALTILLIGSAPASIQAQTNSDQVTIKRSTAEACEQAFEEAKVSRPLIRDQRAEIESLNNNLNLANRLADSERLRADAEAKRATAEAGRADALQAALDASKRETEAVREQVRIRSEESAFWKQEAKKQRRGKFAAIGLGILGNVLQAIF